MIRLLALLALSACTQPPEPVLGYVPDRCEAKAKLPQPPHGEKSIPQVIAYARIAARTANVAIAERDECARDYAKLRTICAARVGCIIPAPPP